VRHVPRNARLVALFPVILALPGCPKKRPPTPGPITCFDVAAAQNSAGTQRVFAARRCQGGGVTWGPILDVLAARQGRVEELEGLPPAGWTGGVSRLDGTILFSIDDEGDSARFCAASPELVATMRREVARLNDDADLLTRAMAAANALAMECLEADGTLPRLPALAPPPALPPENRAATHMALAQLRQALAQQPVWCFPPDDGERRAGALRFSSDGGVTWTATNGELVGRGRWQLPAEELGDDRVEVVVKRLSGAKGPGGDALEHFNLGDSGRIGVDLIGEQKITRSEMVPGDACLRRAPR
jgi:hypothetical protein